MNVMRNFASLRVTVQSVHKPFMSPLL
jgi:hypothetical protein